MLLAHKIELKPTAAQENHLLRACGTARFAYNWALAEWQKQYKAGGKPSEAALRKQLNAIKREQFPWMLEVSKAVPQNAVINLGKAFDSFFAGRGKYPRFKRKDDAPTCRLDDGPSKVAIASQRIRLPKLGWVETKEAARFPGQPRSATISRVAGKWFVSCMFEVDVQSTVKTAKTAGVDLGITTLATLSIDGVTTKFSGPRPHKRLLGRVRRLSRSLSRKHPGSANRRKAKTKLARMHYKVACIRKDALHKLTHGLATTCERICIEDLNVRGMASNRRLARSIMDAAFFEYRRQLDYKAKMYGSTVIVANRWFPSSKTCSCCGSVQVLSLSDRTWTCDGCGLTHDRDENAARNLELIAASSAVTVCGANGSGAARKRRTKPAAMKQKLETSKSALCANGLI
jgi:putative transposase